MVPKKNANKAKGSTEKAAKYATRGENTTLRKRTGPVSYNENTLSKELASKQEAKAQPAEPKRAAPKKKTTSKKPAATKKAATQTIKIRLVPKEPAASPKVAKSKDETSADLLRTDQRDARRKLKSDARKKKRRRSAKILKSTARRRATSAPPARSGRPKVNSVTQKAYSAPVRGTRLV